MKTFRLAFLFFFGSLLLFTACNKKADADLQSKLDQAMEQERKVLEQALGNDVPSLSVLIETPQGKYFSSSTGNARTQVTEMTNFRFASNTKTFTATAILNMMQEGWLHLDDKITDRIPGSSISYIPDNDEQWNFPHKEEITIRQLLQQNAGIYDLTNDTSQYAVNGKTYEEYMLSVDPNHQFSTQEFVAKLTQKNLSYGPPTRFITIPIPATGYWAKLLRLSIAFIPDLPRPTTTILKTKSPDHHPRYH